jgi:hypothetical protein
MIPKQFHGLPVHALAVHATVVLIPLSALLIVLFVIPRTRGWAAHAMALVTIGAAISIYVSRESGFNLKAHVAGFSASPAQFDKSTLGQAILHHESLANQLCYIMIPYTIVVLVVYLMWLRPSWWPAQASFTGIVEYASCAVLIVGAVIVVIWVARVGEAGSKAVWNPDGSQNFNSSGVVSTRVR